MRVAVCIGSGPSLTRADCDRAASGADWLIACNESWRLAEWAHALYAGDYAWWDAHHHEVPAHLEKWTCAASAAERFRLHLHRTAPCAMYNSGQRALELAIAKGFERILLLGYDCSVARGAHWHDDHRGGAAKNPDAQRCAQWQSQFAAIDPGGAQILNCSRDTALTAFPRMALEDALVL